MADEWKMPEWMEPFRKFITNTGGNPVERMMNGNADPQINLPLSTLQACVKSQVALMEGLHKVNMLVDRDLAERGMMLSQIALAALALKINIELGLPPALHALNRELEAFEKRFGGVDKV